MGKCSLKQHVTGFMQLVGFFVFLCGYKPIITIQGGPLVNMTQWLESNFFDLVATASGLRVFFLIGFTPHKAH